MPIGKKKGGPPPDATGPPSGAASGDRVYRIRLPGDQPVAKIVPPPVRRGTKQLTCIRYDGHGQYFVDEYVERMIADGLGPSGDRRIVRYLNCPKFQFQVAMVVCHRYCLYPCQTHIDALAEKGWFDGTSEPSAPRVRTRRGAFEDEDK